MTDTVVARSGGTTLNATLDHATQRWSASGDPDEGSFPYVADAGGKRYELYSDGTFNEVERAAGEAISS